MRIIKIALSLNLLLLGCSPMLVSAEDERVGLTPIVIEAEDAMEVAGAFKRVSDHTAFGTGYMAVPESQKDQKAPKHEPEHYVRYVVDVPQDQPYYLLLRTGGRNVDHNSFWVRVDDAPKLQYFSAGNVSREWNCQPIQGQKLEQGPHTITVSLREAGTQLDRLILTPDPQSRDCGLEPLNF